MKYCIENDWEIKCIFISKTWMSREMKHQIKMILFDKAKEDWMKSPSLPLCVDRKHFSSNFDISQI